MDKPAIDLWGLFLYNEKLTPKKMDTIILLQLIEALVKTGKPKTRPHLQKIASRRLVCETAISLGIDLAGVKDRGKVVMSRALLDIWNEIYTESFGSNVGTAAWKDARRRDIKTKVRKEFPYGQV